MNVEIAERLAKRRKEAGYSQESLAEQLGVSRQAVSKWERSESSPDTDNLIALAQIYGVSLDELLYVDESMQDDVEFEAADRAAARSSQAGSGPVSAAANTGAAEPHTAVGYKAATAGGKAAAEPAEATSAGTASGPAAGPASDAASAATNADTGQRDPFGTDAGAHGPDGQKKKVNIGFAGIHVKDGEDYVHVSWKDGVHVKDSKDGDEVHVDWSGVHVKEGKATSANQACATDCAGNPISWGSTQDDQGSTGWSEGDVIINGTRYDSWDDAQRHWTSRRGIGKAWAMFPFPIVAIIAYLLIGFVWNEWGLGLFVFFSIPVYYMLGHAIHTRRVAPFLEGVYPLGCVAWFLYMAFVLNQPHPAWVIFLTIPVVEWIIHSVARAGSRRKEQSEVIDVEPENRP